MSTGKTRVNITIPNSIKEYYQEKAKDMGVSMAAMMNISLKQQMDQDKLIENIPCMLERIKELEGEVSKYE